MEMNQIHICLYYQLIKNNIIDYTPKDYKNDKTKTELTEIISKLEMIKNDL